MIYIIRLIIEDRIYVLTQKRDEARQRKDYDRVWKLNMKIDKNKNRLMRCSYCKIWV